MFIMILTRSFLVLICMHCVALSDVDNKYKGKCNFPQHAAYPVPQATNTLDRGIRLINKEEVLNKLQGKRYSCKDGGYTYYVGICTPAKPDLMTAAADYETAGAVQIYRSADGLPILHILGSYESAEFDDWLRLTYSDGDQYASHCGMEKRTAIIQLACDKGNIDGTLAILKLRSCYYLFELKHDAVCSTDLKHDGVCSTQRFWLIAGAIICIVFFSVAVYLVVGIMVQRSVRGAQGRKQLPNYTFWKAGGNYVTKGCGLVFRCKDSRGVSGNELKEEIISQESHEPDIAILPI